MAQPGREVSQRSQIAVIPDITRSPTASGGGPRHVFRVAATMPPTAEEAPWRVPDLRQRAQQATASTYLTIVASAS
jgi:hypothetical protein